MSMYQYHRLTLLECGKRTIRVPSDCDSGRCWKGGVDSCREMCARMVVSMQGLDTSRLSTKSARD